MKEFNQPLSGNDMPPFGGIASMFRLPVQADAAGLDVALGSVFGALTIEATHFLLEKGSLYTVAQGDIVFEYGDSGGRFFVVCKGSLDFFKQHQGEWRHIRVVNFGEETGFVPMIALHEQSGTAVAREDSIVLEISSALYAELQQKYSVDFGLLTLNLAREMARVIDKMGEAMVTEDK